jgi:hypothetical protein
VLPPEGAALADGGTEAWRRDGVLNVRDPESTLAANLWPDPYRPSLDQTRRLFLSSCPNTVTYFGRYPYYPAPRAPGRLFYYAP